MPPVFLLGGLRPGQFGAARFSHGWNTEKEDIDGGDEPSPRPSPARERE